MNQNPVNPTIAWICGTALLALVLIGVFVLAWHGSLTGEAVIGVISTVVAIAGAAFGVHAGVAAASNKT